MKLVNDEKTIRAIAAMLLDMQERENTNLPLLTEQLKETQRGIDNLLNAIQQGIFTKSTKGRLEELEAAKEELEIKIANEKIVLLRREGQYIYISGHGPEDQVTGKPLFSGRIGKDLTPDEGRQAARECAIIILGALKDTLGTLDRVERFVKVFALVNCAEGFTDVDGVMDGFSDTLADVLEERGYHARTVMGTHNLPNGNIPCEVEAIIKVRD